MKGTATPGVMDRNKLGTGFLILNIISSTVLGAMQLVVPLYALRLQATTAEIGLIRGISGLGMLLLIIPAGFLVDHFGAKKLFLVGSLAGTISTLAIVSAKVPHVLIWVMGLLGLFSALTIAALNATFYSNLPAMGVEKTGWYKGSISIGLTFSGPLFGALLVNEIDFSIIFIILALLTLVPSVLVYYYHTEPVKSRAISEFGGVFRSQFDELLLLLRRRTFHLTLLAESLSNGCFATFSTFIVVITARILHLSPTAASLLLSVEGGFFILTVFAAGPLIKKLNSYKLLGVSVVVTVIGLACVSFSSTLLLMTVSSGVLGLGLGLINLLTSARIGLMEGEKGKIVALLSLSVGIGICVGPILGGAVGNYIGVRNIFLAFIPLFLLLLVVAFFKEKHHGRERARAV
jgi:MFS family permease